MARSPKITSTDYPFLPVHVEVRGWKNKGSALVDTGFTGELVIPEHWLKKGIGTPDDYTDWGLANKSVVTAPTYAGSLKIVGLSITYDVLVVAIGDKLILGRGILDLFEVTFDRGEKLIVKP